jgi:hypothetical protein
MWIGNLRNQGNKIRGEAIGEPSTSMKIVKEKQDILLEKPPKLLKEIKIKTIRTRTLITIGVHDHGQNFVFQEPTLQTLSLDIDQTS